MIISYFWLQNYLPEVAEHTPQEIGAILTSIGLEVGGIEEVETIKGGLRGIVIGKVLTCVNHPNSDHLHITTVDVGEEEPLPIVCGAPNVTSEQTVVVATVGAILYDGDNAFTIKKSKLRGEPSHGMICSQKELGIGEDTSGIMVLDQEVAPGTSAASVFQITSDYAIEVDITPNRVDATSHYGVARDLAAYFSHHTGKRVQAIKPTVQLPEKQEGTSVDAILDVSPEQCPRYQGITIEGITNGESPEWLQNRLKAIGQNPINCVVDITNYVLHEMGQPLHAFDADHIPSGKVKITTLPAETLFTTLDGVERKLKGHEIMICDANDTPLCMGGIMGGLHSGVQNTTTRIFLESTNFNSTAIRKAARAHALSSDSSFRFERGLDPENTRFALHRAAAMIVELCGGKIVGAEVDDYRLPSHPFSMQLSYQQINETIGVAIAPDKVHGILQSLEINILDSNEQGMHLEVPAYRSDVTRPIDVIEDILRIYGYNTVPLTGYIHANLSTRSLPDICYRNELILSEQLVGMGFHEILNNSLTAGRYFAHLPADTLVQLENPLSSDLDTMRPSLLIGGLESIARNLNRKQPLCQFFEWGKSYRRNLNVQEAESLDPTRLYSEREELALWTTGSMYNNSWIENAKESSSYRLKGVIETLFHRMSIPLGSLTVEGGEDSFFSEKLSYYIGDKRELLCELGTVQPSVLKQFEIEQAVYYAWIDRSVLMNPNHQVKIESSEPSKFPIVKRDLAYLLDETITYEEIRATALKAERHLIKRIELFDVYTGKNLPSGKKSYALSFYLGDDHATLKDKQIDAAMARIRKAIEETHKAQIR